MATDYGTDVAAVSDLPDPEQLASAAQNFGNALARRVLTPSGAMEEIGDPEPYDSLDLHDWLGARPGDTSVQRDLEQQVQQVLAQDPRVLDVTATVVIASGQLTMTAQIDGANGPFTLVVTVNKLSAQILVGGS